RSLPPAQAHGIASAMSARGYQWGPKAGPLFHVTTAPKILTARPTTPSVRACVMGRSGASRAAVDSAIGRRKQEECVDHRLAERREDAGCLQQDVGAEGENDDGEEARKQSAHAF